MPNGPGDYYTRKAAMSVTVLVALGSNRGESAVLVREAMARLRQFAAADFRESSLWQTGPVDCPPGADDFVNAVVAFEPVATLTPEQLLAHLKALEREFGRAERYAKNAPREMDLDLLCFGVERRGTAEFTLPHPRAHTRRFVLTPAAEVAADMAWPGTGRTIAQLLADLPIAERVARLPC